MRARHSFAMVVLAGCGRVGFSTDGRPSSDATDATDAAPCPTWCLDASPVTDDLQAAWADADDDVWAVGGGGAILHRDANGWKLISRNPPNLYGVFGFGSNDVWAFGGSGFATHWDGTTWTDTTIDISVSLGQAWGASPTDLWVVATGSADVVEHWDGTQWTAVSANTTTPLRGLWGTSASDLWAGANNGTVVHYDGTTWTASMIGNGGGLDTVEGLAANDLWTTGDDQSLHWDGTLWNVLPGTEHGAGIIEVSPSEVWFAGTTTYIWNGATWTQVATGTTQGTLAMQRPQNTIWCVGTSGLLMHHS